MAMWKSEQQKQAQRNAAMIVRNAQVREQNIEALVREFNITRDDAAKIAASSSAMHQVRNIMISRALGNASSATINAVMRAL